MKLSPFIKDAAERAVTTGCQATLVAIGGATANVIGWDWLNLGGAFAAGFTVSLLTSTFKQPFGNPDSAGITKA